MGCMGSRADRGRAPNLAACAGDDICITRAPSGQRCSRRRARRTSKGLAGLSVWYGTEKTGADSQGVGRAFRTGFAGAAATCRAPLAGPAAHRIARRRLDAELLIELALGGD